MLSGSPLRTCSAHTRMHFSSLPVTLSRTAAWLAIFCLMVCCHSCLRKGREESICSRKRSLCKVLPLRGRSSPTGCPCALQVITAQLFSSKASSAPEVMVMRRWSSTTNPMSSTGMVRSACSFSTLLRLSFSSTSGRRITNWHWCRLR